MKLITSLLLAFVLAFVVTAIPNAQDRLRGMPGYEQFQKMQQSIQQNAVVSGAAVGVQWAQDNSSFTYNVAGKANRFDVKTMTASANSASGVGPGFGGAVTPGARGAGGGAPPTGGGGRSGGMEQGQTEMASGRFNGCPTGAAARGR